MNTRICTKKLIHRAQWLRGVIICNYAHVEFLLTDLIVRCRSLPEYADVASGNTCSLNSAMTRTKILFEADGPLNAYAAEMLALIERIGVYEKNRHYILHGQMVVSIEDTAHAPIMFQLYQPGQKNEPEKYRAIHSDTRQLENIVLEITEHCHQMMILFKRINQELFWHDVPSLAQKSNPSAVILDFARAERR